MGQYYKPVVLKENKKTPVNWMYSHDYGNGLKLMEHSWLGNKFVEAVECMLIDGGEWYKKPIVWAGDYADEEPNEKSNLFSRCKDDNKIIHNKELGSEYRYIVNHTKKLYVDKTKIPITDVYEENGERWEYRIHPLPLLTCEGNGRGGGDYRGEEDIVGSWARDIISIETDIPFNMTELKFDLVES